MSAAVEPGSRTLAQVQASLRERLSGKKAPFYFADVEEAEATIARLQGIDGANWGAAWSQAGSRFEAVGAEHEKAGRSDEARDAYLKAYGFYQVGRYPVPSHPAKQQCYAKARECYMKAGKFFSPPLERVTVPFTGHAGEGNAVAFYARRPAGAGKLPVVIRWSGIDTWKEERHDINEAFIRNGFASLVMDMPGTGESPVKACIDGERQFLPVLDWIREQPDLEASKIVLIGQSWGGYWATKLAHLYSDRLSAVVNWGGGVHHNFQRDWVLGSRNADSYLMDLTTARASSVGGTTYEEYADRVTQFSLLDMKILDHPHPPMLLVNGKDDRQVPIEDMYLLLQHGAPKSMRLFPGGHMGYTPMTLPTIISWIRATLRMA